MTKGTITGTVTTPVVLGSGNYGATLTVATTGSVYPSAYGVTAITGPAGLAGVALSNRGLVHGGYAGGTGILLQDGGSIANAGTIDGGGPKGHNGGGDGGLGVDMSAGTLTNTGTIAGGSGGYNPNGNGYYGGAGVNLRSAGQIVNSGDIFGGGGGFTGSNYGGGSGAVGVIIAGGTLINTASGHIGGGGGGGGYTGGGSGGTGVLAEGGVAISNAGTINGGFPGSNGGGGGSGIEFLGSSSTLINSGLIQGAYDASGISAAGTVAVTNSGTIVGALYGAGIYLGSGGALTNTGLIQGGTNNAQAAGYGTGAGVKAAHGTFAGSNHGTIVGGAGTAGIFGAGAGGVGILLQASGSFSNAGTIAGGVGGSGAASKSFYSGAGGVGAALYAGVQLTNTGTIAGGTGGTGLHHGSSPGGAGVYIDGGTLMAQGGLVVGGAAGNGASRADAVQFGTLAGTLVIDPGAAFVGNVVANATAADMLDLAGKTAGELAGLGTQFTGFTAIREEAGATWRLDGTLAGVHTLGIDTHATLQFYGMAGSTAIAFGHGGGATLLLGTPSEVTSTFGGFGSGDSIELVGVAATKLAYSAGTLTLFGAAGQVVDTLHFAGSYTAADFALHAFAQGTAVVFAGVSAAETLSGHFGFAAPEFMPYHGSVAV